MELHKEPDLVRTVGTTRRVFENGLGREAVLKTDGRA